MKRALLLATLLALLLQGILPVGMMPDFSGRQVMKMCDGMMAMPMPAKPAPAKKDVPCPYAVAAHLALPLITAMIVAAALWRAAVAARFTAFQPTRFAFGNTGPRGPPYSLLISDI